VHVARCSLATRSGRPSYSECRCCTGPGHLSFPLIVAAAAGLGIFAAPYFSAQKVIVPELLGEDEHVVAQANALTQGATHTTMLLGPPIAGRAHRHDRRGERPCVVDAATFAVSCVLVAVFVPRRAITAPTEDTSGLLVGLRFIARERLLRIWIPLFVIGDAGWAAFFAAVPLLVFERFDANPRIAGLLFAGFGAGALFGNFVSFRFLTQRVDGLKLIAASVPFQAAPLWLLPLPVGASVLIAATFASGLAKRDLQSEHPLDLDAAPPTRDQAEGDDCERDDLELRVAARARHRGAGALRLWRSPGARGLRSRANRHDARRRGRVDAGATRSCVTDGLGWRAGEAIFCSATCL
jgi:hypothetical protein